MDFQAIRKEYEDIGIEPHQLADCPMEQLKIWLQDATEKSPGDWFETNAVSLATSDLDGNVSVRIVLIKDIGPAGVHIFTNYESFKARQLASNSKCSIAIHWPHVDRQIRITGAAEKTSDKISDEYFQSRPRNAQFGAVVSSQSQVIESRDWLDQKLADLEAEIGDGPVERPQQWGGYLIRPTEVEFWQGRTSRLHDRIRFQLRSKGWEKSRLSP